jgi:hypothetical protein
MNIVDFFMVKASGPSPNMSLIECYYDVLPFPNDIAISQEYCVQTESIPPFCPYYTLPPIVNVSIGGVFALAMVLAIIVSSTVIMRYRISISSYSAGTPPIVD